MQYLYSFEIIQPTYLLFVWYQMIFAIHKQIMQNNVAHVQNNSTRLNMHAT